MIRAVRWWLYLQLKEVALWIAPPDLAALVRAFDDAQAEQLEEWAE